MEKNVIDLRHLETMPAELFFEIISKLEPKSLVKVCAASKTIRKRCSGIWKDRFQKDITRQKVCDEPNWKKLYRLALTGDLPVYLVAAGPTESFELLAWHQLDTVRYAVGEDGIHAEAEAILAAEYDFSRKEREKFFSEHKVGTHSLTEIDDDDSLGVMSVGSVAIWDILTQKGDLSLFSIRFHHGYSFEEYFALGQKGLARRVKKTLEDYGIDEDEIESVIDQLEDEDLLETGIDVHTGTMHIQIQVTDLEELEEDIIDEIKEEICKMK